MMKKSLKVLVMFLAVAVAILPCCMFSACSSNHTPVVGDTYIYEKIKFQWGNGVSETAKDILEATARGSFQGAKLVFINDTTVRSVQNGETLVDRTYTINNGKVVMVGVDGEPAIYTIKGNSLVLEASRTIGNVSARYVVTFKLSK